MNRNLPHLCFLLLTLAACGDPPGTKNRKPEAARTTGIRGPASAVKNDIPLGTEMDKDDAHRAGDYGTFRVDADSFRTHYDALSGNTIVEKKNGDNWVVNTTVAHGDDFGREDLDGDGFPDLWSEYQGWEQVHFYRKALRGYDSVEYTLGADDGGLIDARRHLYFSFRERYHGCDPDLSQLYEVHDGQLRYRYFLTFAMPCTDTSVTTVELRKADAGGNPGPVLRRYPPSAVQKNNLKQFWIRFLHTTPL